MLMKSGAMVVLAFGLMSTGAHAAGEDLVGLWNVPDGAGTLEIKDGGTFAGKVKGGADFTGKWEVGPAGVMSLVRDDGQTAKCDYTVAGDVLKFANCPLAGEFKKAP
jgi:hypothetical protein